MNLASIAITGESGTVYSISVDPITKNATCTCPAFYYSGRKQTACKHIKFAAQAFDGSAAGAALSMK